MADVHITLSDTPTGGVAISSDFRPAIGHPCTPAQGHALEIINRTNKQWGLAASTHCSCKSGDLTAGELETGRCANCGKAVLA